MTQKSQQRSTWHAAYEAGIIAEDLWLHYFSIGGNLGPLELDAYLHDLYPLPVLERNLIALALNELIDALPRSVDSPPPRKAEIVDDSGR